MHVPWENQRSFKGKEPGPPHEFAVSQRGLPQGSVQFEGPDDFLSLPCLAFSRPPVAVRQIRLVTMSQTRSFLSQPQVLANFQLTSSSL